MSWTYRVVKQTFIDETGEKQLSWGIHEYYEDSNSWTTDPIEVVSEEGIDGLRWQLTEMLKALNKPVIEEN